MEIEYKGGNCIAISHKKDIFVVDPGLKPIGLKDQGPGATAMLLTQQRFESEAPGEALVINMPGEYEVRNCSIKGVAAEPHSGSQPATMYSLEIEGIKVAVIGHVAPKLTDVQLEELGVVDILVVPVGGYGYTLDPKDAIEIVRLVEPKAVIATNYADEEVKYEVPQSPLTDFTKELGASVEETPKLKLKSGTTLPETLTVYNIIRSK